MLFDELSVKDQDTIATYLGMYAPNYNSTVRYGNEVPLKERLRVWSSAKSEYLYRLLNNQFILEKKIEYTESPQQLSMKIANAFSYGSVMEKFNKIFRTWYNSLNYEYYDTAYTILSGLMSADCLARETLGAYNYMASYLPYDIDFGDGRKMRFESTTKPMRAIGKLVKMFNLDAEAFEAFRIEHSRLLNTKKITGTLCLSIHPMDYMTMSMNSENWTSCMNWSEPGGYRGGTIEVMNSKSTIVAYLKSDTNELRLDSKHSWNSKKWRLLTTITPEGIFTIKSYPYHHATLAKAVAEWVRELAADNLKWYYSAIDEVPCCSPVECKETHTWYNVDFDEGRMMYCDWGCDKHYGCFNLNPEDASGTEAAPIFLHIQYCGPMTCMICGDITTSFYDESYVICDGCCSYGEEEEDGHYCERCGCWIPECDEYWVDDICYCEECVDEIGDRCAVDGVYYHHDNLEQVYLAHKENEPDVDEDERIAIHRDYCTGRYGCYIPGLFVAQELKNPHKSADGLYYFNREDLSNYGFRRLFELWDTNEVARYFAETK